MTSLHFALTHAWREGRAAPRRLALLAATVALGVGALTAINGFTENLRDSIREQSRSLLGADLRVGANHTLPPAVDSIVHTLAAGGAEARITSFGAMAFAPAGETTRLVDVQGVQGAWPFYGDVVTEPAGAWSTLATSRHALIDPVLLTALGVKIGDSIAIGSARFVVAGTITSLPGDIGVRTELAPRVYLPAGDLPATGLLGFGARVRYDAYVRLPAGTDVRAVAAQMRPALKALNIGLRTASDDEADLNESLTTLARYLGLVALASLLLGGIGVASASHELVARRLETVAVLRCLGASGGTVLIAYLLQAGAVGLAGGAVGAAGGTLLQLAIPHLVHDFVPVQVHVVPAPASIVLGVALGFWVTVVFALGPLLAVRRIPPLAALRRDYEPAGPTRDPWRWAAWAVTGLSVVLLAALQVRSLMSGIAFTLGLGIAVLALAGAAQGLIRLARRWVPARLPYPWRQGLANLHRPANQTGAVVLALGFGAFLLVTLFLVEQSLIARFAVDAGSERPNLVFFDIQPDQAPGVDAVIRSTGIATAGSTPIVPMRIRSVKG
ncbi:MAG: ABC transporter permease, partial [Gemmatimonadales bacterium]